jgi:clan AA aspartic protease (TIGR02281 family)
MQISISPGRPIRIPIRVYGQRGARELEALLDTGSLFMTVPTPDAIGMGYSLEDCPRVPIVTANGLIEAPLLKLSRVVLGEFVLRSVPAICLDIDVAGASSLLGLSLLVRLNVFIDHKAGTLTITDP